MGVNEILQALDRRRRGLRMSYAALAKRSRLSMPTIVRTLSGHNPHTSFGNVLAVAEALGMALDLTPVFETHEFLERQAEAKARQLVGMVQGTSALEGQALDRETLDRLKRQTVHQLLAGSRRALWSD